MLKKSQSTLCLASNVANNSSASPIHKSQSTGCLLVLTQTDSLSTCGPRSTDIKVTKRVSFDYVEQRQFRKTLLGDNPATKKGVAIAVGGVFTEKEPVPLDQYENERCERRRKNELLLSVEERKEMLRNSGYSDEDIEEALFYIEKSKREREITKNNYSEPCREEAIGEAVETVLSKMKKRFSFIRKGTHEAIVREYIKASKASRAA